MTPHFAQFTFLALLALLSTQPRPLLAATPQERVGTNQETPMQFQAPKLQTMEMQERIERATEILDKKQRSGHPIPDYVFNHARGIALFSITRGGFLIGGQAGAGIVMARLDDGIAPSWTAPSAFDLNGASIGAQIGFSETRYIVILNTAEAVRHFTASGKIRFDATANGTAGSDHATGRTSTTELERRDIVVYTDSDGAFVGATLGGTSIQQRPGINQHAYGSDASPESILDGTVTAPGSGAPLYLLLNRGAPASEVSLNTF